MCVKIIIRENTQTYICQNTPVIVRENNPRKYTSSTTKYTFHQLRHCVLQTATKCVHQKTKQKCTLEHPKMYPFFKIPNKMHFRQNAQQNSLHVQQNIRHNTRVSTPETKKNSSNNTNTSEVKAASNMLHIYYKKKHKNWENILLRREAVFLLPR